MNERVIPSVYYGVGEPNTSKDMYHACADHLRSLLIAGYPRYVVDLVMEHDYPRTFKQVMEDYASSIDRFY